MSWGSQDRGDTTGGAGGGQLAQHKGSSWQPARFVQALPGNAARIWENSWTFTVWDPVLGRLALR